MSNFLKLFNFEWNRFIKLYSILFGLVFIVQMIGLSYLIYNYKSMMNLEVGQNHMSPEQFIDMYGAFGLDHLCISILFIAPIGISVAALLFYVPFIWYRDWFARNTFIYRLFMLPTSRMNLLFAKLATIIVGVLSIVAYQLILLVIYKGIISWMVPSAFRNDVGVLEMVMESSYLSIVLPGGVMEFLVAYGLGMMFVIVIFTAILMERSFRWLGAVVGALYIPAMAIIFYAPLIIIELFYTSFPLYDNELFYAFLVMWIIITVGSLLLSRYLLNRKVTV